MEGLATPLRDVGARCIALDELDPSVSNPIRERHWKALTKAVASNYVKFCTFNVLVLEEPVLDGVGNEQISTCADDEDTFP